MRYTLLLIAAAALPLAWGSSEVERAPQTSAGEAEFALDILYRQKIQPRPIRMWRERFRGAEKHAPGRASRFDPLPSPARSSVGPVRSGAGVPVVPS